MQATVLSLMVLTALALVAGAWWLWRKRRAVRQALLMLVLAAVIAVNVAIWAVPTDSGQSLATAGTPAE
jgi:drug/metabolite transporter superfamily protein YnfA